MLLFSLLVQIEIGVDIDLFPHANDSYSRVVFFATSTVTMVLVAIAASARHTEVRAAARAGGA